MAAKPFVSKAQVKACYKEEAADKKAGREVGWNCKEAKAVTKNIASLPKHVKKK